MDEHRIAQITRNWVETVVVGLNLCPFAKRELNRNAVRFVVTDTNTEKLLLSDLETELNFLTHESSVATTLLIHPHLLGDFFDYNQFLNDVDDLIVDLKLEGVFQVASFHPNYQFAGTNAGDAENFTNRSPYPMLHILREADLAKAIDSHPDVHAIPENNQQLMRDMGPDKVRKLLQACYNVDK